MMTLREQRGQATVEYLIVGVVIMVIAMGLAAIYHLAFDGTLAAHISQSSSHVISSGLLEAVGDVSFF